MAYLRKTINFGLLFGGGDDELYGYCDADYAGDLVYRRSTSRAIFTLHDSPFSWFSRRQSCIALSTTESEFISAAEGTKGAIWLKRFHSELGARISAMTLRCYNQGDIAFIYDPVFHQRTKHECVSFLCGRHKNRRRWTSPTLKVKINWRIISPKRWLQQDSKNCVKD